MSVVLRQNPVRTNQRLILQLSGVVGSPRASAPRPPTPAGEVFERLPPGVRSPDCPNCRGADGRIKGTGRRTRRSGPARAPRGRCRGPRRLPRAGEQAADRRGQRRPVVGGLRGGSGGRDWPPWRRRGGEPERRREPSHRVRLRHRPQDPPRAAAARTDQDLDRKHPAQELGPGSAARNRRRRRPRVGRRRLRHDGRSPASVRGEKPGWHCQDCPVRSQGWGAGVSEHLLGGQENCWR
jgi:hypothetical protein